VDLNALPPANDFPVAEVWQLMQFAALHQVLSAFHRSIRRRCHRLGDGLYRPGGSREEHHECEACEAQARATLAHRSTSTG